jgi:hypothetical protein
VLWGSSLCWQGHEQGQGSVAQTMAPLPLSCKDETCVLRGPVFTTEARLTSVLSLAQKTEKPSPALSLTREFGSGNSFTWLWFSVFLCHCDPWHPCPTLEVSRVCVGSSEPWGSTQLSCFLPHPPHTHTKHIGLCYFNGMFFPKTIGFISDPSQWGCVSAVHGARDHTCNMSVVM